MGRNSYDRRVAVLVQRDHDGKTEWALKEKDGPKILKWFGPSKPSDDAVAKEERRIQFFKHKAAAYSYFRPGFTYARGGMGQGYDYDAVTPAFQPGDPILKGDKAGAFGPTEATKKMSDKAYDRAYIR